MLNQRIVVVDVNRIPQILLQTFLTVAEAGQISEAARRLHLSQPTVTGHIRRLEASLETTLFIRSARGVSLTERGAHLRERVQDVFAELEEMLREVDQTREVNGTLTLAASTTVARYFVPRIFIRFHHYHPAAALHLIVGNTEEVLDHLRQQRVGLGLVDGHQRSPGVRLEQFMPDEIVPVCAARIPDPKLRRAVEGLKSVRDLETLPLIWRESGSGTRAVVESALKDAYDDSAPAYGDQYWQDLAMKVQWALSRQGYYHGPIDGVIGPDGMRAIRAFQEAQGLPATGRIDPNVLRALKLPIPQVSSRSNSQPPE